MRCGRTAIETIAIETNRFLTSYTVNRHVLVEKGPLINDTWLPQDVLEVKKGNFTSHMTKANLYIYTHDCLNAIYKCGNVLGTISHY